MLFNCIFYILLSLTVLYISQFYFDQNEFSSFIKLFIIGLLYALFYKFVFGIFDSMTETIANPLSIWIKYIIIDGLLFIAISSALLYGIIGFFNIVNVDTGWKNTSFLLFALLSGYFTIYSIYYNSIQFIPNTIFAYMHYASLILIISTLSGLGISKFIEGYSISEKLISLLLGIILPVIITTPLKVAYFYGNLLYLVSIPIATVLLFVYIKKQI
ncbi:MAG: hypothetical protein A2015_04420 [Spirochaetes bacterium GWF1_31_7]|nr:MAG: hypothetical protein A2Y30_16850 [Spirochaetes bacterium GWE1_32_154]OHD51601.1 MAG: hypothetical protein A2Y29_07595 [Spirochaetes bacterium GWE2_31_10]OHD52965.1 MAG: hypothetical protein A2015_04420 [Spirochaetes bacterium GWF1_31_7]OHD73721.1 MAG: hypothetical protein A2355_18020 [Spirochaetes bacterium RIFOXYB1_FULL_32_8]HBD93709.1 hypothetical protein [Spirochaetia bacterium]